MIIASLSRPSRSIFVLLAAIAAGCSSSEEPAGPSNALAAANPAASAAAVPYSMEFTIAEIMDAVIMREANVLWNSVSYASTEDGFEMLGPETEEDWSNLRYAAVSLAEATNNLLIPGRHANGPDVEPGPGELAPADIDALMMSQRGAWTAFAQTLRASAGQALEAIDERDVNGIFDVGGAIDEACEGCHLMFWYPEQ